MQTPDSIILYVASPPASAAFYESLLERRPLEASPGFAMFALDGGTKLGLWARADVQPEARSPAGSGELVFTVESRAGVDELHADWRQRGLPMAQAPVAMDFGYTFVALDPDGHRLRVFTPAA